MLALLLILPLTVRAFTPAELEHRRAVLVELEESRIYATEKLPPCDDEDYVANALARITVDAKKCPLAHRFRSELTKGEDTLRAICHEHVQWVQSVASDESHCPQSQAVSDANQKRQSEFRKRAYAELFPDNSYIPKDAIENPQGEFALVECSLSLSADMQARKSLEDFGDRSFQWAQNPLYNHCDPGMHASEEYRLRLRYGEHIPEQ